MLRMLTSLLWLRVREAYLKSKADWADLSFTSKRLGRWSAEEVSVGLCLPIRLYEMTAGFTPRLVSQKSEKSSPSLLWSDSGKPCII